MAKYKVKNIHIAHNNKVFKEGSVIELEDKHAAPLSKYLDPVIESNKQDKKNAKNKAPDIINDGSPDKPNESDSNTSDNNTQTDTNGDTPNETGGNK